MKNNQNKSIDKLGIQLDTILNKKYQYIDTVGEGCFGKVLKVRNKASKVVRALKIEKNRQQKSKMVLKNQIKILLKLQGNPGIPKVYDYGNWKQGTYLQMQLLQRDLNYQQQYTNHQLQQLAGQLLRVLMGVHDSQVIHQDIKPQNIMVSKGEYYLVDFGLSNYLTGKNPLLMKGFIGTPRYASIRAHGHFEQTKKDDLQSLFYNLAYLFHRKLPWSKLNVSTQKKLQQVKLLKMQFKDTLFEQMPPSFQKAFAYINSLAPFDQPNYNLLIGYFRKYKTVILHTPPSAVEGERSKLKRNTTNTTTGTSNFLTVPGARPGQNEIYKKLQEKLSTSRQKVNCEIKRSSRRSLSSAYSDLIISELISMNADSDFNIEDFTAQEQAEKTVSFNSNRSIVLKNPFI